MTKTALLSFSPETGMWTAEYAGNIISQSMNKSYIKINIENGTNKKANLLGVTKCVESTSEIIKEDAPVQELIEFDINERFQFLADYVDMCSTRDMKSVVICGSGGLGKTYTVLRQLERNSMINIDDLPEGTDISNMKNTYKIIKGYSTAKGLFRTIYENKNSLIIFDDCDSVLDNETSSNIIKAAADSYDRRIVTWNAETFGGNDDLPKSFEFTGSIIFITNKAMSKIPQAILSRSAAADVSMTRMETVERMRMIVSEGEFMPEVSMEIKNESLDFIQEHIDNQQIKAINLRTLISVVTNRRCKPENWKRRSLSMMIAAVR